MLISETQNIGEIKSGNVDKELLNEAGAFYFQAIENADGVPFQLIFGKEIGEGYYPNNGGGIKDLLGISPGDLTERLFMDMIEEIIPLSPEIPTDPVFARKLFIDGYLKAYRADIRIKNLQGKRKWIRESSLPLLDKDNGKVIGAFGILFDVSHIRNNLYSIQEPEESVRLKTAFLRNVSHEIRTPLNAIVGLSSIIGEPGQSPEQLEEFRTILMKSSDHLLDVVMNIIEMSKIDAGMVAVRNEKVNISQLLTRIYEQFLKPAEDKGIQLHLERYNDESDIVIRTDMYKLTQVLKNIVGNAVKFTANGDVVFGIEKLENKIVFFVSDNGPGIPIDQQQNIFKCFSQIETSITRHYGGIGLGLAISKAYIELMGGNIDLYSRPGKGSCFRFSIPNDQVN